MKIILTPDVALKLMSYTHFSNNQEFSGVGFVRPTPEKNFEVYDFVLMDVGTFGWTEFNPMKMMPLQSRPDARNMKIWIHRHPVGNGVPGMHNWSSTDEATCTREPFGSLPEMVRWSLALVITPGGWVGRYDDHVQHKTVHLEVEPPIRQFLADAQGILRDKTAQREEALQEQLEAIAQTVIDFDPQVMEDLGMDEEDLWNMLTSKVKWGSHPTLSWEEWLEEQRLLDEEDLADVALPDWRNFVWGSGSSLHRMTDDQFRQTAEFEDRFMEGTNGSRQAH